VAATNAPSKNDLISGIAERMNVALPQARLALESVTTEIAEALKTHHKCVVHGFGTFRVITVDPHPSNNMATGERVVRGPQLRVYFRAGRNTRRLLTGKGE